MCLPFQGRSNILPGKTDFLGQFLRCSIPLTDLPECVHTTVQTAGQKMMDLDIVFKENPGKEAYRVRWMKIWKRNFKNLKNRMKKARKPNRTSGRFDWNQRKTHVFAQKRWIQTWAKKIFNKKSPRHSVVELQKIKQWENLKGNREKTDYICGNCI